MSVDTSTPRQRMLLLLSSDLDVQGWDQKNKLWFVKGEATDEWLEYAGEFTGAPENHLLDLIIADQLPKDAHGVLVATEGWDYPKELNATFKTEASRKAYWETKPPSEHPDRIEIRHLLLACNDGDVLALTISNEPDPVIQWASVDASTPCPIGDRTADAARALVGLNEPLTHRLYQYEGMKVMSSIGEALDKALSGDATDEEVCREIFLALPEKMRHALVSDMPEELRDLLRRALTDEEQNHYGL